MSFKKLNYLILNQINLTRNLSLSSIRQAKKVIVKNDEKGTIVEGIPVDTHRKENLVDTKQVNDKDCCPICALDLKPNYSDVLILSQYLNEDNKIIPLRLSGLCGRKYHLIDRLIRQAQKCNLLPKPKDHIKWGPWEDLNHYVDYPNRKRDQPMKIIRPYYTQ